jgi:hypothetical protein
VFAPLEGNGIVRGAVLPSLLVMAPFVVLTGGVLSLLAAKDGFQMDLELAAKVLAGGVLLPAAVLGAPAAILGTLVAGRNEHSVAFPVTGRDEPRRPTVNPAAAATTTGDLRRDAARGALWGMGAGVPTAMGAVRWLVNAGPDEGLCAAIFAGTVAGSTAVGAGLMAVLGSMRRRGLLVRVSGNGVLRGAGVGFLVAILPFAVLTAAICAATYIRVWSGGPLHGPRGIPYQGEVASAVTFGLMVPAMVPGIPAAFLGAAVGLPPKSAQARNVVAFPVTGRDEPGGRP